MLTGINETSGQLGQGSQTATPQHEVPALASSLEFEVAQLDQTLSELSNRLAPVRMSAPVSASKGESPGYHGSSPLGSSLAAQIERVRAMSRGVRGLMEELAV